MTVLLVTVKAFPTKTGDIPLFSVHRSGQGDIEHKSEGIWTKIAAEWKLDLCVSAAFKPWTSSDSAARPLIQTSIHLFAF